MSVLFGWRWGKLFTKYKHACAILRTVPYVPLVFCDYSGRNSSIPNFDDWESVTPSSKVSRNSVRCLTIIEKSRQKRKKLDITDLPNDIFLLIIAHLSPSDLIGGRSVSRKFYAAFTESHFNRHVLQRHYPRARELRSITSDDHVDWSKLFAGITARYHYLKAGRPRSVEKLALGLGTSFVNPEWSKFCPVHPWHRHLAFEEKTAPFHYLDPLLTYEQGLLILPSLELQRYTLYDLSTGNFGDIEFDPVGEIVRRTRLNDHVLVVGWCEQDSYHKLNQDETVYRHFATAYDLVQDVRTGCWSTVFRSISSLPRGYLN